MLTYIRHLFRKEKGLLGSEENTMKKYLIVGLGNIGSDYENTRHNIGFKVLDFFARKEGLTFETQKLGDIAYFKFKGRQFIFLKPSTETYFSIFIFFSLANLYRFDVCALTNGNVL